MLRISQEIFYYHNMHSTSRINRSSNKLIQILRFEIETYLLWRKRFHLQLHELPSLGHKFNSAIYYNSNLGAVILWTWNMEHFPLESSPLGHIPTIRHLTSRRPWNVWIFIKFALSSMVFYHQNVRQKIIESKKGMK